MVFSAFCSCFFSSGVAQSQLGSEQQDLLEAVLVSSCLGSLAQQLERCSVDGLWHGMVVFQKWFAKFDPLNKDLAQGGALSNRINLTCAKPLLRLVR